MLANPAKQWFQGVSAMAGVRFLEAANGLPD
ncbi:hypothetical protein [Sulfitobacter sp. LC.270.F.C4]